VIFSGPLLLAPPPDPKRRIGSSRGWKTGTITRTLEPNWDPASQAEAYTRPLFSST